MIWLLSRYIQFSTNEQGRLSHPKLYDAMGQFKGSMF